MIANIVRPFSNFFVRFRRNSVRELFLFPLEPFFFVMEQILFANNVLFPLQHFFNLITRQEEEQDQQSFFYDLWAELAVKKTIIISSKAASKAYNAKTIQIYEFDLFWMYFQMYPLFLKL